MSLYSVESLPTAPEAAAIVAALAKALGQKRAPPAHRVAASSDGRSPDEGLALLAGYVAIPDTAVRQAILDLILGIADINPHD